MKPINELNMYSRHFMYDDFIITIIHYLDMYDVWAGIDGYDRMQHLFGIEKKSIHDFSELLEMVRGYIDDNRHTIHLELSGFFD